MKLERPSPCKVNLLLNILGKRSDGFHELETVMHPVALHDTLQFERKGSGIQLTCSDASLPVDNTNLVYRAAASFLAEAKLSEGIQIHLEKRIPMAAGLGGGSGNAANTLAGMNEIFGHILPPATLVAVAARLGSDVPFFLQGSPALATGRGEVVHPLDFFPALKGLAVILIHPGFGISTPWAYKELARFPNALNGRPGRARELVELLQGSDPVRACRAFYNSLEAPVLHKYPVLKLYQEFFLERGALGALMSGSGSTTFALVNDVPAGQALMDEFSSRFGQECWTSVIPLVRS